MPLFAPVTTATLLDIVGFYSLPFGHEIKSLLLSFEMLVSETFRIRTARSSSSKQVLCNIRFLWKTVPVGGVYVNSH